MCVRVRARGGGRGECLLTRFPPAILSFTCARPILQEPWDKVKEEMTKEKGLPEEVADRIGEYVKRSGMSALCCVGPPMGHGFYGLMIGERRVMVRVCRFR